MRLYLIRHAETELNRLGRFQGSSDYPINENGKKQVQALIEHFKDKKIDIIYCSEYKRTRQTAMPIAEVKGIKLTVDKRLNEVDFGEWESLDEKEIMATDEYKRKLKDKFSYSHKGGSSYKDVYGQLTSFFEELNKESFEHVLIISHMIVMRLVMKYFGIYPDEKAFSFKPKNNEIYEIDTDLKKLISVQEF